MTATPTAYVPRFYSEVVREVGSPDDCAICAGLELYDAATLGEGVTRDDGTKMDTIALRERRDDAGLKPNGSLRLNDIAQYLAFVSKRAGLAPPFKLDYYPGHPGGTLRVTFEQFRDAILSGSIGILLGNPIGIKDPQSPLRTAQNSDDYGHAIAVMDGNDWTARVFDALRWKEPTYRGARVSLDDLRQFTETKKAGDRLYGTPLAIACALAEVGSETAAARATRARNAIIDKVNDLLRDQVAQTRLATEERDDALAIVRRTAAERDDAVAALAKAAERVKELEAAGADPDALNLANDRIVELEERVAKAKAALG